MTTLLLRARNGLFVTAIGLMLLSLLAPAVTLADTSLSPGTAAVVAGTNGDGVALRSDMSTSAQVLQTVPEGTPLQIVDGPLTAADGSLWYSVSVNGTTGYVAADFVSGASGGGTSDASTAPATEAPTQAATQAPVTGPAASTIPWKQAVAYAVVNDNIKQGAPQIGIVCRADVSADAPVITQINLGDTIEITGNQVQSQGVQWLPVNCAGVGGFIDANWLLVTSQVAQNQPATEAPTQAPTEAPTQAPTEVVTQAPTQAPADTTQVDPTQAPVDTTQSGTPAATDAPATDVLAAVAPTTPPATDAPATQDVAVVVTVAVTTAPAVDTGHLTATGPASSDPTASEPANGTPAVTVAATEPDATTTAAATQPADTAATTPATPGATDAPTQEATQTTGASTQAATPATEQTATASTATAVPTQDVSATATPGVDLSKSIGSATVQGTNGEGVTCRVAPADDAAIITVLPEGQKVAVMGMPSNGWLPIACADQIGYAPVQYMWQGGAVQGDFSASDTGGTVTVEGTGNGLNCRSGAGTNYPVIAVLPDGTTLVIRGQPNGDWLPVTCAGQDGWVSVQYVSAPQGGSGSGSNSGSNGSASGGTGTATVTGTGGDGVRCRASASTDGAIITVLAEGTQVTTTGAASNGWQPVTCAGQSGYVSSQYLTLGSSSGSGSNGSTDGGSNGGASSGDSVTVTGTGNGLNCRSGPGTSYGVITVVFDGTTLTVRGAASNGWLPVVCASQNGYVSTDYVTASGGSGSGSNGGGSDPGSQTTGTATVTGTGGDGVRCRASASTDGAIITVVAEGQTVSLRGAASNGWQPVVCGGQNGYIYAQYLSTNSGGGSGSNSGGGGSGSGATSGLANGDHAQTTDVLNLRYQPSMSAGIATTAPAGTVVLITGGIDSGYYPVDWDGLKGWMSGDYLVKTDAALSKRGGSANDGGSGTTDGGSGTATGNAIVNYAMGYVGYPYVWNTHGPSSFDCSGFTYWVILHVLGIDIGTGLWTQVNGGTPIARDAIQPGDLVFFQNTFEAGLSHVGIYIGNGQFVHAENEQTGVKVSDLGSDYYSSRWYGAVRYS